MAFRQRLNTHETKKSMTNWSWKLHLKPRPHHIPTAIFTTCHDSVYDALFLALMSTQAIAGLTLIFTPQRPTTRDPSSDLCLLPYSSLSPFAHDSFVMSHPLSIITNGQHHREPHRNLSTIPIGSLYTAYPLVLRYAYLSIRHWLITIPMYYLLFRSVPIEQ